MQNQINILNPRKALNKAFLKVKPNRTDIEKFKSNLVYLLDSIDVAESEEFHKNLVSDFLKKTYYDPGHFINTKGKNDLVIHNGDKSSSSVGVIIEAKNPANKAEMLKIPVPSDTFDQSLARINVKAFHELLLYYLRERIILKNIEIRHLVVTNIYEWFIFDAIVFDRLFAQNKDFVSKFSDFENNRLSDITTDFFYKEIAQPFISQLKQSIEFTYFDIREYDKPLRNSDKKDDNKLIALFKLLSPEHILKLAFANDSNSLDKRFYGELLHIIGLTETKENGKKIIDRNKAGARNTGSILENAIIQLDSLDKISRLQNPGRFGANTQERIFNIALELSITWINRILFLKLLEAQLVKYHKGNEAYEFLNTKKIRDYDDLNSLFFDVLARRHDIRNEDVVKIFAHVPYLNSSLFEPTETEHLTLFISQLRNDKVIPVYGQTVLKDNNGKKRSGEINPLQYLFEFLDAYDFASEGNEEIQEENKTLINASVLGLIFEKINGYKDGSFFTPGFITMYMSRETIRKAVIHKFNDKKSWNCKSFNELKEDIDNAIKKDERGRQTVRKELNDVLNQLRICDPAVGSGHFLVSSLNEMIAIKSELGILVDRNFDPLSNIEISIENDELSITDLDNIFFEYNPKNKESQRIQETLFHEKQTIIENCLFGVDINPNSVKICRLRLWIELLKNAYYKNETELETLPNIDINIKSGNSLISRFALDADLSKALKSKNYTIDNYRIFVDAYRNAENKEQKREMERLIDEIKSDFRSEISRNDPKVKRLANLNEELGKLNLPSMFEKSQKEIAEWEQKVKKISDQIDKAEAEIEEIKNNKIYENAFEWRFEFPEVLDDEGNFVGFDVVIGNPPYFSISTDKTLSAISDKYLTYSTTGDIYALFIELSKNILRENAISTLIISNKWLRTNYGQILRKFIISYTNPLELIDFGQNLLFEHAVVHTSIISFQNSTFENKLKGVRFPDGYFDHNGIEFVKYIRQHSILPLNIDENVWNIVDSNLESIKIKCESIGKRLKNWDINFRRGILTGFNEAFIIDGKKKENLIKESESSVKFIKPILRGRDTRKYFAEFKDIWLLNIPKGYTIKTNQGDMNIVMEPMPRYGHMIDSKAWNFFSEHHPAIANHLIDFETEASKRDDQGDFWWELRACSYISEFEKPKIIFSEIVSEPQFYYDEEKYYPEATVFFISGEKLKYLTALLNSRFITYLFRTFYMGGELVGKIRYKKAFLEQVPIYYPSNIEEQKIESIVDDILKLKKENPNSDTSILEAEIDRLVYELYGLTEEEISLVESQN